MSDHTEQTVFTEKEAIEITIACGYDGSEFETVKWKKNGSLDPSTGTIKQLNNKLETIFDNVEVTKERGKKRRYILIGKKEKLTERRFNYKGSLPTAEDELMEEYIFNRLLKLGESEYTYSSWIKKLKFPSTDQFNFSAMKKGIKTWYQDQYYLGIPYNPEQLALKFIEEIYTRSKGVVTQSFQRLEKDERIKTEVFQVGKVAAAFKDHYENEYIYIPINDFEYFRMREQELVEEAEGNYKGYKMQQKQKKGFTSKKYKEIHDAIQPELEWETELEYVYSKIKVTIIDHTRKLNVSNREFIEAYFKRFLELMSQRQNKDNYKKNIDEMQKRFFYFNMMIFLDMCVPEPFAEFNNLLETVKHNHYDEVQGFIEDIEEYKKSTSAF